MPSQSEVEEAPNETVDCPECEGYGSFWDAYFGQHYPCETCGGSGEVYEV
jgi:DnaJ-class molecular chaperone